MVVRKSFTALSILISNDWAKLSASFSPVAETSSIHLHFNLEFLYLAFLVQNTVRLPMWSGPRKNACMWLWADALAPLLGRQQCWASLQGERKSQENPQHEVTSQLITLSPVVLCDGVPTKEWALSARVAASLIMMAAMIAMGTLVWDRVFLRNLEYFQRKTSICQLWATAWGPESYHENHKNVYFLWLQGWWCWNVNTAFNCGGCWVTIPITITVQPGLPVKFRLSASIKKLPKLGARWDHSTGSWKTPSLEVLCTQQEKKYYSLIWPTLLPGIISYFYLTIVNELLLVLYH